MIDIHCHLLPGVDDGAVNLHQSLEMARMAVADGITHAVMTPHIHPGRWENNATFIEAETRRFQAALRQHNIPLKTGFGAEVRLTDQLFGQLERNEIPFLGQLDGFSVMLLEFPHSHIVPGSEKFVDWLLKKGVRPLIAHPERNKEIMKAPQTLKPFRDRGCLVQVTSGSVVGKFGRSAQTAALYFLDNAQVDVIASDAHNTTARGPAIASARAFVAARVGEERAEWMTGQFPRRLTENQFCDD